MELQGCPPWRKPKKLKRHKKKEKQQATLATANNSNSLCSQKQFLLKQYGFGSLSQLFFF
jgi:hypothetical protein